jgi:hypothetical protein
LPSEGQKGDTLEVDSWQKHSRLQRTVLLLWGLWLPFVGLLLFLPRDWFQQLTPTLFLIGVLWVLALAFLGLRLGYWPCPRCGQPFFVRFGLFYRWKKECPHCGLELGQEP